MEFVDVPNQDAFGVYLEESEVNWKDLIVEVTISTAMEVLKVDCGIAHDGKSATSLEDSPAMISSLIIVT